MATKFKFCDACGQAMMVYRRGLRKGLIFGLIALWKNGPSKIADLDLTFGLTADLPKLRFWGLLYKLGEEKRSNVVWEITNKGKDFLTGLIEVPKYVFIYNNKLQRFSKETIKLIDVHHEKIDFESVLEDAEKYQDFTTRKRRLESYDVRKVQEMQEDLEAHETFRDRRSSTPIRSNVQGLS